MSAPNFTGDLDALAQAIDRWPELYERGIAVAGFFAQADPGEMVAAVEALVERVRPATVVIAVEGARRRAEAVGEWLVEEIAAHTMNTMGHDMTAFVIVIEREHQRGVAAARIAELGSLRMGGGTILFAEELADASIRSLLMEQTL